MGGLFENPWPATAVFALLALAAGAAYLRAQTRTRLVLVLLLLVAAALPPILDVLVVSPAEEVRQFVDALIAHSRSGDAEFVAKAVSADYNYRGLDGAGLARLIRAELGSVRFDSLKLNGLEIQAGNTVATTSFVAVASGTYRHVPVSYYPLRLTLSLQREPAGWRIYRIQRFNPVQRGEELDLTQR